ncbi:hypothetical protein B566_EDAN002277 [Ephemera danica]|nr:hypothetical protein B566_EDAN002277 [Ephemera danica]
MNDKEKANDLKKERIQASLEKKKACFRKAKECVEILLENNISESSLLGKVQCLSQADYQDVVEERAILKICGYAVCSNVLKNIPTKQYQISTVSNKVYDLTERKNFCSSRCYKASCYLKEQIPISHVWLRDGEDLSGIHLLPSTHVQCQPGVEIALSLEKVTIDVNKKQATQSTVSMFACNALEELKEMGGEIFESLCIVEQTTTQQMSENNEGPLNVPEDPKKMESVSSKNTSSLSMCENVQKPEPSRVYSNSSHLSENIHTQEPFDENPKSANIDQCFEQPKENLNRNVFENAKISTSPSIPFKSPQNVTPSIPVISDKKKLHEERTIATKNVQLGECPDRVPSKNHNMRIEFVEKSVQEWFSPDSMNYLAGETRPPPQPEVQNPTSEEEIKVQAFYRAGLAKKQDVSDKTIPVVEKLSKMNAALKTSLTNKKSKNRLSMMLRSLQLEDAYLDTFVEQLFNNAAVI